jgi:hypothetical protein
MIDRKIVYTKQTPINSKKYFIDFLKDKNIEFNRYKKGNKEWIIIRSEKPLSRYINERIDGFLYYCGMIEELVEGDYNVN